VPQDQPDARDEAARIATSVGPLAISWTEQKLTDRILDIRNFVSLHNVVPLERRRQIRRAASELLQQLDGFGGLDTAFLDALGQLAAPAKPQTGRGGDRRTGQRGLAQSVLGRAIELQLVAKEKTPTLSEAVRFANEIGQLVFDVPETFKSNAVKAELRRKKRDGHYRRLRSPRLSWYKR
jgi:hypothetical protein